ncbi:MAG: MEDS domain-containing protein [Spirochaetota bacterium]
MEPGRAIGRSTTNHERKSISVGFCPQHFEEGTHMCLVFRDETNRRKIVSRFVESGIAESERVYYFADTVQPSDVLDWLESLDVDVSDALAASELTVAEALATYCPDGCFDPDRMLATLRSAYSSSVDGGYPASRVTGEMSWALREVPGAERLMEYEAAVNEAVKTHPITAMCQYDANRFDGRVIFQALQVHPYMVMNGQLVRNPYYAPNE